jgi:hypothetical protein
MAGMNHKRAAAVILAAALVIPLFIGATRLAGWGSGGDDGKAGSAADDAQTLRDFAATLQASQDLTYTATYATAAGVPVTAAQEAPQRIYRSAAAVYLAGPDATVLCRTPADEPAACTRSAGTDGIPLTHARNLTDVLATGFIAPELVSAYISRLAARVPGKVVTADRDVAGLRVSCVEVVSAVAACATAGGVLAHFQSPDGRLTLTAFQPAVAPEVFALPAGALVTDLDG